ncbi:MAG: response regulator [Pseudomonadota bacterium]
MHCLIVEDDAPLALLWQTGLEQAGFETTMAGSIDQATHALRFQQFDVVLLDLFLGEEMSFALTTLIGYTSPKARIVIVTGSGAFPYGEAFREYPNIAGMLHKPVKLNDLIAYLEHLTKPRDPA